MNIAYMGKPPEENAALPPPSPNYLAWMLEFMKLNPQTEEEKLTQRIEGWERLNGQKFPLDPQINRQVHSEFLSRLRCPPEIMNHIRMLRSEDSEAFVRTIPRKIDVPTTILHGTEDPIFPPAHGAALKQLIPHAEYQLVEGMGHVPSDHFYDLYIDILVRQAKRASS
jgi:pimeloyl-ACP methyl ester carboxylesterase